MLININIQYHDSSVIYDFIKLIYAEAKEVGVQTSITHYYCPSSINFIIESFRSDKDIKDLKLFKDSYPNSKIYMIATEIIRNGIFNSAKENFSKPKSNIQSIYENSNYWKNRTDLFLNSLPYIDHIFCMSQETEIFLKTYYCYQDCSFFKLTYLKYFQEENHIFTTNPYSQKNDYLFTGTITPYREKLLDQLNNKNYLVHHVKAATSEYFRISLVKGSRISLGLKHKENTPQLSVMRAYWYLMNNTFALHERVEEKSYIDPFILIFENIFDTIEYLSFSDLDLLQIALQLKEKFKTESEHGFLCHFLTKTPKIFFSKS